VSEVDEHEVVARLAAVALLSQPRERRAALHLRFPLDLQRSTLDVLERFRAGASPGEALRSAAAPLLDVLTAAGPRNLAVARVALAAFGRIAPDAWLAHFADRPELALRDSARWLEPRAAADLWAFCTGPEPSTVAAP
jgi:hypothetical protein